MQTFCKEFNKAHQSILAVHNVCRIRSDAGTGETRQGHRWIVGEVAVENIDETHAN